MFAFAYDDCAGLLVDSEEPIHCMTCFETEDVLVKHSHYKSDQLYLWVELWHTVHGAHVGWVSGCRG